MSIEEKIQQITSIEEEIQKEAVQRLNSIFANIQKMKVKCPENPIEPPYTLDKEVGDMLEEMTIDWEALTPIHQSIREQFPTISRAFDDLDEMVKARTNKPGDK